MRKSATVGVSGCTCESDQLFLRRKRRPRYEIGDNPVRVVDLFCGAGALSLGVAEAARRVGLATEIALACDIEESAVQVYRANFPLGAVICDDVEELVLSRSALLKTVGKVDLLIGGPPCQGHSDLNNHSRRSDPRNSLYSTMAFAAVALKPSVVLVENVPSVDKDRGRTVDTTAGLLTGAGYTVISDVVNSLDAGVAQSRRRHFLLAFSSEFAERLSGMPVPVELRCPRHPARDVRWAIGDLTQVASNSSFDAPSTLSRENERRIEWLFRNDQFDLPNRLRPVCHRSPHSYKSMYGRLRWNRPAQTITTGFSSMGQGRFVHPSRRRTLTPHEAARLQSFPDFFRFSAVQSRTAWATMIGNAVPPLLAAFVMERYLSALRRDKKSRIYEFPKNGVA